MAPKKQDTQVIDYTEDLQHLLVQIMISDPNLYTRCQNIIQPNYFTPKVRKVVSMVMDYANEYKSTPSTDQIKAITGVDYEIVEMRPDIEEWFLDEVESFCRHKAIEEIILDGPDILAKGMYGSLETRIKDALTISLQNDLGTDYFASPIERLEKVRSTQRPISTGWEALDYKLYGGWARKTLNIFAGQPGAGKSLFLQNIALNYMEMGFNVVYFTLELSEELVSMRFDSMITRHPMSEIFKDMIIVDQKIADYKAAKKPGSLRIKKMPESGTTTNVLRAFLKEYTIQTGIIPDVVVVDYLDLVAPNNHKVNPSDFFVKDKYVSEELRALSFELDCILMSASQLNRGSFEAVDFDMSHVAGGISKLNTADNLITLYKVPNTQNPEYGQYQLQLIKTRSSAGQGSKVQLKYCVKTLRVTDFNEDDIIEGAGFSDNIKPMGGKKHAPEIPANTTITTSVDAKRKAFRSSVMAE